MSKEKGHGKELSVVRAEAREMSFGAHSDNAICSRMRADPRTSFSVKDMPQMHCSFAVEATNEVMLGVGSD